MHENQLLQKYESLSRSAPFICIGDCAMSTEDATEPSIVANRGDSKLTDNSLIAHLATIMRLEHIGILLGSGASVDV